MADDCAEEFRARLCSTRQPDVTPLARYVGTVQLVRTDVDVTVLTLRAERSRCLKI